MEKVIFYLLVFIIGTLFGSFFTLAVYRLPLHQNITHKRSYCPNCNHKLSFWDMIPIFSYLFLGGKCRYCNQKIRIRYILLEILTGIIFLTFAMSLNIFHSIIEYSKLIYLIFGILYLVGIIIIAGIDKEKHSINKPIILYEVVIITIYMVYLYTVEQANIYRYAIYLFFLCIFLLIENIQLKKKLTNNYPLEILELSMIIAIYTGEIIYIITVILTLLIIALDRTKKQIIEKKNKVVKIEKDNKNKIPIAFYLVCSNILLVLITNWIIYR